MPMRIVSALALFQESVIPVHDLDAHRETLTVS